jgi:hypothetical protein
MLITERHVRHGTARFLLSSLHQKKVNPTSKKSSLRRNHTQTYDAYTC